MGSCLGGVQGIVTSPSDVAPRESGAARSLSRFSSFSPSIMPLGMVPLVVYVALFLLAPACLLVLYSFWEASFFAVEREFTLINYIRLATSPLYTGILAKTLACSLFAAGISVVIGYAIAYAIVFRLKVWGPRILVLVMASLLSSYIVRLYALTTILGTNGLINQGLLGLGIIEAPLGFLLYGYTAIIIALVYVYLPFAVLPIYASLQDIDRRLLEASRDLGSGASRSFFQVTLPLSMRGVRTAFAFCFILGAADYFAPRLVGGMNGQMIGSIIANQFGGASNYPFGAALSVAMVLGFIVILGALYGLEKLIRRSARWMPRRGWRFAAPDLPFAEVVTALALVFLFAPLVTVFVFSFNAAPNPGLPFAGFTVHWYAELMGRADFHRVLLTSLGIGVAAVVGGMAVGVPAALALARRRFALKRVFEPIIFGPIAVPGVVLGVALLTAFVFTGIRLGVWPAAAAHVLLVAPFIVLVVRARLEKMNPQIEEAARDLGSPPLRVFRTVTLPLIAPALLGAGILAAAISLDELLVTNFVIGAQATVPVWIASSMRTGLTPALNAAAVLMLVGSLGLIALAAAAVRLRRSARSPRAPA
jgi:ABC-type spermidine/putrescine transport system permease subunit II